MATLTTVSLRTLLAPYTVQELSQGVLDQLSTYLDLLLRWNARTNLTAIRDPEEIVRRHFGESLFAAEHVPLTAKTLLDLGSGAGFPGLPIQILLPHLRVTLAESQNKKAAFLQEAVRVLGVNAKVWPARVETLPVGVTFDVVTLRAVDNPTEALRIAAERTAPGGALLHLTVPSEAVDENNVQYPVPGGSTILRVRIHQ